MMILATIILNPVARFALLITARDTMLLFLRLPQPHFLLTAIAYKTTQEYPKKVSQACLLLSAGVM